jgi:hypothetical protein
MIDTILIVVHPIRRNNPLSPPRQRDILYPNHNGATTSPHTPTSPKNKTTTRATHNTARSPQINVAEKQFFQTRLFYFFILRLRLPAAQLLLQQLVLGVALQVEFESKL